MTVPSNAIPVNVVITHSHEKTITVAHSGLYSPHEHRRNWNLALAVGACQVSPSPPQSPRPNLQSENQGPGTPRISRRRSWCASQECPGKKSGSSLGQRFVVILSGVWSKGMEPDCHRFWEALLRLPQQRSRSSICEVSACRPF